LMKEGERMVLAMLASLFSFSPGDESTMIPKFVPRLSVAGWEYWSDVSVAQGCRVQKHAVYDGYRILDESNKCIVAGSREKCDKELAYRVSTGLAKPFEGEVVLLLHGVLRSSRNTATLGKRLEEQGFTVVRLDYASTCLSLEKHAENLGKVVASLDRAKSIHLVGHSMGGLVTRRYLGSGKPDPRIKRVVMLGTPNHGAELADMVADLKLFGFIFGPAGQELCTEKRSAGVACDLPQGIEAAVVAGGLGHKPGINPILKVDNDGVVTVESTKLAGACDFLRVKAHHGALLRNAEVAEAVGRFLRNGKLRPDSKTSG